MCDECLATASAIGPCPGCGAELIDTAARSGSVPERRSVDDPGSTDAGEVARDGGMRQAPDGRGVAGATSVAPLRRSAPVTFTLLVVYVVVFGIEQVFGSAAPLTVLGAQINAFVLAGEWWRVLSATMLHAGITHLAFNGYALYVLGPQLERGVGSPAFGALYVAAGLAGGLAFLVGAPTQNAVGASGAIFGLFGAYLAAAWVNRDTPAGRAGLAQLGILLAVNLALPLLVPSIAWQAHLGGLVAGAVIGLSWAGDRRRRDRRSTSARAVAVPSLIAVVLLAALLWYT